MVAHKGVVPYEGGVEGCNSKSNIAKSTQKSVPLLRLPWLKAFLLDNQLHYGQLLNVCTNYVGLGT